MIRKSVKGLVGLLLLVIWLTPNVIEARPINPFASYDRLILDEIEDGAINKINEYRELLNVPALIANDKLQQTAQAHANYIEAYPSDGHYEENTSSPLFVGESLSDRLDFFNYTYSTAGEGITYLEPNGEIGVDHLFDAPYHRLSIIDPFYTEAGTGFNNDGDLVIDFGTPVTTVKRQVLLYPYENQKNVKVSWYAYESPNPLRFFKQDKKWVGYPISFTYHGEYNDQLQVEDAALFDEENNKVPTYNVLPNMDDHGSNHVFIIPQKLLASGKTYHVVVKAKVQPGVGETFDVSQEWDFTTASEIDINHIYFEKQDDTNFLTLEWASGQDPDAVVNLKKDAETYLELSDEYQMQYQNLIPGKYTLEVNSPHFGQIKQYEVNIANGKSEFTQEDSLVVTNFSPIGTEETQTQSKEIIDEISSYDLWQQANKSYQPDKVWHITFNTDMDVTEWNQNRIYVLNEWNEKVGVFINQGESMRDLVVSPPPTGYHYDAKYKLVIEPLHDTVGNKMTNGIQMPFEIETLSKG